MGRGPGAPRAAHRGQVAGAARRAVTTWHASHPDPAGPTAEDPDDPLLPEPLGGRAARNVQSWPAGPGMAYLLALLPAEDAAAMLARLDAAVTLARQSGDPRTGEQVRADCLAHYGWHGLPHQDLLPYLTTDPNPDPGPDGGGGEQRPPTADERGTQTRPQGTPARAGTATDPGPPPPPPGEPPPPPPAPGGSQPPGTDPPPDRGSPDAGSGSGSGRGGAAVPAARSGGSSWELAVRADPALTAATGRVLARVHVTVDLATLLGLRDEPADLATAPPGHRGHDLGPVFAQVARALAASQDADWQRFLHDDTGLLHGVSRSYRVPTVLRRTVLAAYTTCTAPGCTRPAAECDTEHLHPWQADSTSGSGGHTEFTNLHAADRRHHNLKTHGGWQCTRSQDGRITWTSPLGQTVTIDPADYRPYTQRGTTPPPASPPSAGWSALATPDF